jgi:putative redox protein
MSETRPGTPSDPEHVWAEETRVGRYQVAIHAAGVRLLADQPVSAGGLGSGPTPHELMSAALAACTVMTMRMYADRKGWAVDGIEVRVSHTRGSVHDRDVFDRLVSMQGVLDDTQTARLLDIANRCPVHVLLERGADIHTRAEPIEPPADRDLFEGLHKRHMEEVLNDPATLDGV